MRTEYTVEHYIDAQGHDCYRVCSPEGICSTVSSAHLVEERIAQLERLYPSL